MALGDAYRVVVGVEWEATATAVLVARQFDAALPPFPIWDSVTTFDGRPWRGVVDLITAGFPCQPFSVAGKRGGVDDERHIWPHIARIIGEVAPGIVFLENVPGLLTTTTPDGRFSYELVAEDLHGMGYDVAAGIFSAAEAGASHNRERLFILAYAGHSEREGWGGNAEGSGRLTACEPASPCRAMAHAGQSGSRRFQEPPGIGGAGTPDHDRGASGTLADAGRLGAWRDQQEPFAGSGGATDAEHPGLDVADTSSVLGRCWHDRREDAADADASSQGFPGAGVGLADSWCERSQGDEPAGATARPTGRSGGAALPAFPPGPRALDAWRRILDEHPDLAPAIESPVRGVADGLGARMDLPRAARLRIVGNGVVPQQAALAFRTLWAEVQRDS